MVFVLCPVFGRQDGELRDARRQQQEGVPQEPVSGDWMKIKRQGVASV
jgi:hypothetical protein